MIVSGIIEDTYDRCCHQCFYAVFLSHSQMLYGMMNSGNGDTCGTTGRHTGNNAMNCAVFLNGKCISCGHIAHAQRNGASLFNKRLHSSRMGLNNCSVKFRDLVAFFRSMHGQVPQVLGKAQQFLVI